MIKSVVSEHFQSRLAIRKVFDVLKLRRVELASPVIVTKRRVPKRRKVVVENDGVLFRRYRVVEV